MLPSGLWFKVHLWQLAQAGSLSKGGFSIKLMLDPV